MEPFPSMEGRRRLTLSNQLSVDDSNLRELLMDHQEEDIYDDAIRRHAFVSRKTKTLATVLACEKRNDHSSSSSSSSSTATTTSTAARTLLDIIRNEVDPRCLIFGTSNVTSGTYRIRWKSFKDRLRLRRASGILSSTADGPSSTPSSTIDTAAAVNNSSSPRLVAPDPRNSAQESISTTAATVTFTSAAMQRPSSADEPLRISLMALLEQTDRMGGPIEGQTSSLAAAMIEMVEKDGEDREGEESLTEEATSAVEKGMFVCCVCMVRHKGAAFIPCGHTFCRLCSRELWVSRGNCPLCNGFILEILDIF